MTAFPKNARSALISLTEMQRPRRAIRFNPFPRLPPTRAAASKPLLPLDQRLLPHRVYTRTHTHARARDRYETKNSVNLPATLYSVPYPRHPSAGVLPIMDCNPPYET